MDYMVLSVLGLHARDMSEAWLSYDIACSYSQNFGKRLERYPDHLSVNVKDLRIKWSIPRFHIRAHGTKCQVTYDFAYARGAGRTHGETIETGWADINPAALSTREMSDSFHHETLDDIMGAINWGKLTRIGNRIHYLLQSITEKGVT